ncbi:MAG: GntR family transcriptional regulator [Capsulimonadaceae bacterium]|nr:GntR family transcriptional regulator [Capsulimonadaceae bacterium]
MPVETNIDIKAPLSKRIAADLRQRIANGDWAAGTPLPSRRELAKTYGVALRTIEEAMGPLIADGVVRTKSGNGTFVAHSIHRERATGLHDAKSIQPLSDRVPGSARAVKTVRIGILFDSAVEGGDIRLPHQFASAEKAIAARGGSCCTVDLKHPSFAGLSMEEGIAVLCGQGVEGIISMLDRWPRDIEQLLGEAADRSVPVVHAGGSLSHVYRLSVDYSSVDAAFRAASHLFRRGCRSVLVFSGYRAEWVDQRVRGAVDAAAVHGMPSGAVLTSIGEHELYSVFDRHNVQQIQVDAAYEAGAELLTRGLPADGVIAVNDHNAYGFMRAAGEAGYVAGRDFAIAGFDDFPESAVLGLTTIRPPMDAMGREAVDMVYREIAAPGSAKPVCLASDLIARTSTMSYTSRSRTERPMQEPV